jgi:predicted Zn-ribbon and HTH transcriptional regulator
MELIEKDQTNRQRMIDLLSQQVMDVRDLSRALGIREKEVYEHLTHIARSVAAQGKALIIEPARCLVCGFVFKERKRYTRPSRCPCCKKSHIDRPLYRIE